MVTSSYGLPRPGRPFWQPDADDAVAAPDRAPTCGAAATRRCGRTCLPGRRPLRSPRRVGERSLRPTPPQGPVLRMAGPPCPEDMTAKSLEGRRLEEP